MTVTMTAWMTLKNKMKGNYLNIDFLSSYNSYALLQSVLKLLRHSAEHLVLCFTEKKKLMRVFNNMRVNK